MPLNRKTRIVIAILAGVLGSVAGAIASYTVVRSLFAPADPGGKVSYSMDPPDGWDVRRDVEGVEVMYLSPQEGPTDSFRENINLALGRTSRGTDLDDNVDAFRRGLGQALTDVSVIDERQAQLNGVHARRIVYAGRMGDMELKALAYVLVKGRQAYVITCTAFPGTYDRFEPIFEETCRTMTIR